MSLKFNQLKSRTVLATIVIFLTILLNQCVQVLSQSQEPPKLYFGPHVKSCSLDSPELYYRHVALSAISTLHEETKGFFGILMDKLEISTLESDESEDEENTKLEEQWMYIMETVQRSLDSAFHRIRNFWGIAVSISNTEPLPWEKSLKSPILHEFFMQMEYQYAMIEAIVKSGVKEIVGSLQKQINAVVMELQNEVSKLNDGNVTEMSLLDQMDKSLKKMDKTFIGNLLTKIVERALKERTLKGPNAPIIPKSKKTFLSDTMEQSAIVFEAFRQKGQMYPTFWREITKIMQKEYTLRDISEFFELYTNNEDEFILNVIAILSSNK